MTALTQTQKQSTGTQKQNPSLIESAWNSFMDFTSLTTKSNKSEVKLSTTTTKSANKMIEKDKMTTTKKKQSTTTPASFQAASFKPESEEDQNLGISSSCIATLCGK